MKNSIRGLSLFFALVLATSIVSAISKQDQEILDQLKRLNKPAVKSIKSSDGDIIDCVKLTNQPAFDHPLLKNHKIQLSPSFNPERGSSNKSKQTDDEGPKSITQVWHLSGSCPEGTIPIKRTKKSDILREMSFANKNLSTNAKSLPYVQTGNEEAIGFLNAGKYYGTKAILNIWNPTVNRDDEYSKAQIWVIGLYSAVVDSIEAGWHVSKRINNDKQTRFFTFWTNDGHKTGCYNLNCPGFVQVSKRVLLGGSFSPVSSYGNPDFTIAAIFQITRDPKSGNWWLKVTDEDIGYWPNSLFTYLTKDAAVVQWGGSILNHNFNFQHTDTQMGSGHFAEEGGGKASFISKIQLVDENNALYDPPYINTRATRPGCYNVIPVIQDGIPGMGKYLFFGGPGRNSNCT